MKKLFHCSCIFLLCFVYSHSQAQAFDKNNIMVSLGIGIITDATAPQAPQNERPMFRSRNYLTLVRPQIQFRADFGVQRYLSVGFMTTIDRQTNLYNPVTKKRYDELNLRLGSTLDFHFYQLMADKMHNGPKLRADKWDIYAGFTFGDYLKVDHTIDNKTLFTNKPFISYHVGVKYRINEHWGLNGEVGYGQKQIMWNAGIVYYFGGPKKRKREIRDF
jgi:hypothetical protein